MNEVSGFIIRWNKAPRNSIQHGQLGPDRVFKVRLGPREHRQWIMRDFKNHAVITQCLKDRFGSQSLYLLIMSTLSVSLSQQIRAMRKTELHVHLEGSIRPETVLRLAEKNQVMLPAHSLDEIREWYRFRDFPHFVEVYVGVTKCIKEAADLEFIAREFFEGQANQNIGYSEATFTASTVEKFCGIPFDEQLDALNRARSWASEELGVEGSFILDIVRGQSPEDAMKTVGWVASALGNGVCALGIAGYEKLGTRQYAEVFQEVRRRRLPVTAHAGETEGAWSIWETLEVTGCKRIGHGVRAFDDPSLIEHLVAENIMLEVCPTSNVRLGVFKSLADHPVQKLRDAGVKVTINSDDPPMFGTTLTDEFASCAKTFGWSQADLKELNTQAEAARFA